MSEEPSSNPDIAEIQQELASLRKMLKPDELAKLIDRSYLSVNNLRAFLQILSIVITIFVAGAVYFGSVGVTSILRLQEEAEKVTQSREKVVAAEEEINKKIASFDIAQKDLRSRIDNEVNELRQKTDTQIAELSNKIQRVESQLREISKVFNQVAVSRPELLNARERQLLMFLAREIDPDNPLFRFNAAHLALGFARYDEALEHLDTVLKSGALAPQLRSRAQKMQAEASRLKENPPALKYEEPGGFMVGQYGVVTLPANILHVLVNNGLLTVPQAQEVIDASKRKGRYPRAYARGTWELKPEIQLEFARVDLLLKLHISFGLNMRSGELCEQELEQGSQQRFPSSSHVVNKLKEAQIQWQIVL